MRSLTITGKWRNMSVKLNDKDYSHVLLTCRSLVTTSAIFEESRGRIISGGFRSITCTCEAGKIWTELKWKPFEYPVTLTTAITANGEATVYVHDLEFFRHGTNPRGHACSLVAGNSAKNTDTHMSGAQWPKTTFNKKRAEESNATRRTLHRSLSQDYRQVLPARVQVRLQHRYRRTHLMILSRVQQQHEVTVQAFRQRETLLRDLQKSKTQIKGTSFRHRETGCETCQCGWRSSQKNLEDEGVLASRDTHLTLIRIEIRNCPTERQKLRNTQENQDYTGSLQGSAVVMQYLVQKTLVTW